MNTAGICFVTNAKSHRVARHGSWCDAGLAVALDVPRLEVTDFSCLRQDLMQLVAQGAQVFVIEGGDGTVLAVLSACAEMLSGDKPLRFAILPGGSTNLAYKNFGLRARTRSAFHQRLTVLCAGKPQDVISQRALSIVLDDRPDPLVGFVLSTGTLARAMSYVQREFHGDGHRGSLAVGQAIWRFMTAPHKYLDRDGVPVLRGSDMNLKMGDVEFEGAHGLSILTSFARLSLGVNPFWGQESGGIAATYAHWPLPAFRSGLLEALTFKRVDRLRRKGFVSHRANDVRLEPADPVMVDGELIDPPKGTELCVALTPPIAFVR